MEYWWDKIKTEGQSSLPDEKNAAEVDLSKALKKLVSIAKLYHYKIKVIYVCYFYFIFINSTSVKKLVEKLV